MEIAALEIARMSEEIDGLREEVAYEQQKRMEAESHLLSIEDRIMEVEMEIRESLFEEMEGRMREEIDRWKAGWVEERECMDGVLDKKVEILMRGVGVEDDSTPPPSFGENKENEREQETLRDENVRLQREIEILRREVAAQSPSKKFPLRERKMGSNTAVEDAERRLESLGLGGDDGQFVVKKEEMLVKAQGSPMKKVRKFTARKWDVDGGEEVDLI